MNSTSLKKLENCHPDLIKLAHAVNAEYRIQVICGVREEKEQNEAHAKKLSKRLFPDSKHNINHEAGRFESHAIDVVPDPDHNPATLDWRDLKAFNEMLDLFLVKAKELNINIRLGRDFGFRDFPHLELICSK